MPTCRNILAIDMHHIVEVKDGGPNEQSNLLALCPTCHALYTRGTISREAIYAWKTMLITLNQAFDRETISNLLFLHHTWKKLTLKVAEDTITRGKGEILEDEQGNRTLHYTSRLEETKILLISGDGVLKFSHLIASGLADYVIVYNSYNHMPMYHVTLTDKGKKIVSAWFSGNQQAIREALEDQVQEQE